MTQDKKVVLTVSTDMDRLQLWAQRVCNHITDPTIFTAMDGASGLSKLKNVPPSVLICDTDLPKMSGLRLVDQALMMKDVSSTAFILYGSPPEEERHLDELVTGRVQYLSPDATETQFVTVFMRALNFSSHLDKAEFHLRYLASGEVLLKEGDSADFVYFVKRGQLRASKITSQDEVTLGLIEVGEFVGEMAYINGEPRGAHVCAITDCELIEVPIGHFESILFKRPSWSKALMLTLSKRVKKANEIKMRRN